jgi:hypothetical protein
MKIISFKIDEIRERLSLKLSKSLNNDGFEFKKTNSWFIRTNGEFDHIIYLLLHARTDHYAIEPFLYIRQKQVEKNLKKIVGSEAGITMGNSIGIIYNSPDGKKVVRNLLEVLLIENADIESAVESIEGYYERTVIPFFNKYNSLETLNEIFNNPPFEYNPAHVGGMFDGRCMRGLIIGRLVNNINFEKLVATYDEAIMKTMNQKSINDYNKVKEYLMYNRIT